MDGFVTTIPRTQDVDLGRPLQSMTGAQMEVKRPSCDGLFHPELSGPESSLHDRLTGLAIPDETASARRLGRALLGCHHSAAPAFLSHSSSLTFRIPAGAFIPRARCLPEIEQAACHFQARCAVWPPHVQAYFKTISKVIVMRHRLRGRKPCCQIVPSAGH